MLVPRLQIEGREDVRVGAETGLPQDRLKAHAAGEDYANPTLVRLHILPKPAQEFIHRLSSFRGDAVVVALEHPVDEDRQLVDREHHRPLVLRQRRKDSVAPLPPVSAVDPGPQLYAHLGDGERIDSITDLAQDVIEPGLDPPPDALRRLRLNPDLGNGVRGSAGILQIDENRLEAPLDRQAAQQLPNQTRLPHPPLRGQQRVGSVPHPLCQHFELDFPVEEPVPFDPVRPGLPQSHRHVSNEFVANDIVGKIERCQEPS